MNLFSVLLISFVCSVISTRLTNTALYYTPLTRGAELIVDGIPFISGKFMVPEKEGALVTCNTDGVEAGSVYILGCNNSIDKPNPDWGGSVDFENYFVGDSVGTLILRYSSGLVQHVPLVFGYSVWWGDTYRSASQPFASDAAALNKLNKALFVANGSSFKKTECYLKVDLNNTPLESISIKDNPAKAGHFIVNGITISSAKESAPSKAGWKVLQGGQIDAGRANWLKTHTIDAANAYTLKQQAAVKDVSHLLSTYPADITSETVAATQPEVIASDFPGPKIKFTGSALADLLTNIYYENANQLLERVDDSTGQIHESAKNSDYYSGPGTWVANLGAFYQSAYTRIRALTLLSNMGFVEEANRGIDFFNDWLMYYPRSFPKVQMAGKPVPAHASVVANNPHFYFDVLNKNRWPTKFKTRDMGNPENDGHGMLMLSNWRIWAKDGRQASWVSSRWETLDATADYIRWALDNPELSFSKNGLLHSESEGGMLKLSMYCDFPCYLGLLAYAEMADAAGETKKAKSWRSLAARLYKAMDKYYPIVEKDWGKVWDAKKSGEWVWTGDHSTMAPILFGTDLWGYDPINKLSSDWATTTLNTYRRQKTKLDPPGVSPRGLGYGQSYITESSLLLDDMAAASKNLEWLERFCFAPRLPHPYRVPEGITIKPDGSEWRRWGDLGNLYQLGEVVHIIQIVTGIDDTYTNEVKLMPRLTNFINGLEVENWPVRTLSGNKLILTNAGVKVKRNLANRTFDVTVRTDKPINSWKLRVGPFPLTANSVKVTINGINKTERLLREGDSKWAWVAFGNGKVKAFEVLSKAY